LRFTEHRFIYTGNVYRKKGLSFFPRNRQKKKKYQYFRFIALDYL